MDAEKVRVLEAINYRIDPCCGLCTHSNIPPFSDFGECDLFKYRHEKHVGDERRLSINRHGVCPDFGIEAGAEGRLHGFVQFLSTEV